MLPKNTTLSEQFQNVTKKFVKMEAKSIEKNKKLSNDMHMIMKENVDYTIRIDFLTYILEIIISLFD